MKFIRSRYPDWPGTEKWSAPCWRLQFTHFYLDADWNTKFPFGFSIGAAEERDQYVFSTCLDINAPLGEPNRFYLGIGRWHIILGLPSIRVLFEGEKRTLHIDGVSRYRYHQDETGQWVRNDKPEPFHWNWLTIERKPSS